MIIFRRLYRYLQAQRLVPAWLPASERELPGPGSIKGN